MSNGQRDETQRKSATGNTALRQKTIKLQHLFLEIMNDRSLDFISDQFYLIYFERCTVMHICTTVFILFSPLTNWVWDVGIWTGLGWPRIETVGGRL